MKILIRDSTVITLADPSLRQHLSFVIDEGRIREMIQEPAPLKEGSFDQVLSGTGKLVLPAWSTRTPI